MQAETHPWGARIPSWRDALVLPLGFLCGILSVASPSDAQIVFDGNLNPALDGVSADVSAAGQTADYQIGPQHGTQVGSNLFLSFWQFSVGQGEQATFSGPTGLGNIIGAVTGPEISTIDGTLSSTVFGANLWLINPNGVVFGQGAQLEVKGGFHVSTADHLSFPGNGRFSATQPGTNVLVAADPSAFGFLDDSIGTITSNGAELAVPFVEDGMDTPLLETSDFSIVGGEIHLTGAGAQAPESERVFVGTQLGDIRIASVASAGELPADSLDTSDFARLGSITLDDGLLVSSSGVRPGGLLSPVLAGGSGKIEIVGQDLTIENAQILSRTARGGRDAGAVRVDLRGAFSVETTAGDLIAGIQNYTAPEAGPFSFGNAQGIHVHARTIDLGPRTEISSTTTDFGNAGSIELTADEAIRITGAGADLADRTLVISNSQGDGRAGSIRLAAPDITLDNGASLVVETRGKTMPQATIEAEGNITIGDSSDGSISTDRLVVSRDARIDTSTRDLRPGGRIEITTRESVLLSGAGQTDATGITSLAQPESTATGRGGEIVVTTPSLVLEDGATISARSLGDGDAGSILLDTQQFVLTGGSEIATSSVRTAGGNITIEAIDLVLLRDSQITTSVRSGTQPGGNIDIDPVFVVLDNSLIQADADAAPGGNITIVSEYFLADEASVISASSNIGLDGEIVIRSPAVDLSAELESLPDRIGVPTALLREACAAQAAAGDSGSFVVAGRDMLPRSPDAPLIIATPVAADVGRAANLDASSPAVSGAAAPRLFAVHCGDSLRNPL